MTLQAGQLTTRLAARLAANSSPAQHRQPVPEPAAPATDYRCRNAKVSPLPSDVSGVSEAFHTNLPAQ